MFLTNLFLKVAHFFSINLEMGLKNIRRESNVLEPTNKFWAAKLPPINLVADLCRIETIVHIIVNNTFQSRL